LTAANAVTFGRIALIPLFVIVLLDKRPLWAAGLFLILALSDALDGILARYLKQTSDLGAYLDPLADKILVICALLGLIQLGLAPAVPVMLIVAREFAVSGFRILAAKEGRLMAASNFGKWKTVSQILAVLMLILNLPYALWVLWLAVLLTILSGVDYYVRFKRGN